MVNEKISIIFLFFSFFICVVLVFNFSESKSANNKKSHITRYGSVIGLKKEYEERYIILHKHAFPGVLDRIRKCNIRNYSIFLKDGILFSFFEYVGADFKADMEAMADETSKDWWKLTDPMQQPLENRKEGEWWSSLELLYQMDRSNVPYEKAQRRVFVGTLQENQLTAFKSHLKQFDEEMIQILLEAPSRCHHILCSQENGFHSLYTTYQ